MVKKLVCLAVACSLMVPIAVQAVEVDLNASIDWHIQELDPTEHRQGNGLLIDPVLSNNYESLASFDLSGVANPSADLIGATLEFVGLYGEPHRPNSFGCCMGQTAHLFDSTTGAALNVINWNSYYSDYNATATAMTGLGVIANGSIADGTVQVGGPPVVTTASAAELLLIKAILDGGSGDQLSLHFAPELSTNRMYWGDTDGSAGDEGVQPGPLLTLEFRDEIPEPSTVLLSLVGVFGLALRRRRS